MEDPSLNSDSTNHANTTRVSRENLLRQILVITQLESIICEKAEKIIAAVVHNSKKAFTLLSDHKKRLLEAFSTSCFNPHSTENKEFLNDFVIKCELMSLTSIFTSISDYFSVDFFSTICKIPCYASPEPENYTKLRGSIRSEESLLFQENYNLKDRLTLLIQRFGLDVWHPSKVTCIACYGNRMISCGKDGFILIWDLNHYYIQKKIKAHDSNIKALCISDSGCIYSGGLDKTVKMFNIETGIQIYKKSLDSSISCICLNHAQNKALVGTQAGILKVLDVTNKDIISFIPPSPSYFSKITEKSEILSICVTTDDKKAICSCFEGNIFIWDLINLKFLMNFSTRSFITSLTLIPNMNFCGISTNQGKIHIWDLTNLEPIEILTCRKATITCTIVMRDEKTLISGGSDFIINIWSLETFKLSFSLNGHEERISGLQVLNDDYFVAADDSGAITKWCLSTRSGIILNGRSRPVNLITSTADRNKLISCSDDGVIKVNSLLEGNVEELVGHRGEVNFAVLNLQTGLIYSAGNDGCVRVWNPNTGKQVARANMHINGNSVETIDRVKISESGNIIFSRSSPSKKILVYDLIGMCKEIEINSEDDSKIALMKYPEMRELLEKSCTDEV